MTNDADAIDTVLAELTFEVDRIVADLSPNFRRRDRQFAEVFLRDRMSQLMHRSVREGAKLVGGTIHSEQEG